MKTMQLIESQCRIRQAERILSLWMEADGEDEKTSDMIGAVMSLLEGVHDSIEHFRVTGGTSQ
ncbi:Uncharacterised protein [Cedecea lapagei]|uniref:Prophage protein n=1 Tax=Cedecea lapagei TaxID=158823 RepID=A0A3S4KXE4_9ENTR|nr:Uncharacterised protein [Cedecea lapagei]